MFWKPLSYCQAKNVAKPFLLKDTELLWFHSYILARKTSKQQHVATFQCFNIRLPFLCFEIPWWDLRLQKCFSKCSSSFPPAFPCLSLSANKDIKSKLIAFSNKPSGFFHSSWSERDQSTLTKPQEWNKPSSLMVSIRFSHASTPPNNYQY